ncbi:MAG: Gfo/Idh/MocA family oxidoreductase [Candidatus Tectomicrobia bacterium]|uniref:Gfo/Idh/MocA family oxidoreductase n=1 Tax=Tectimicrobiota bacterium TaxID=2528274 RepID=A0A932HX27_UNCTE|nr:Gfo/Idh/MocA family oxidoreductase [Candidatus Tectomicrobia bacterium]
MSGSLALRFLVAGCGSVGKRHLRNLRTLGVTDLLTFDVLAERCREASAELGVEAVASLEEAWARGVDAVLVTVPTREHYPLALEAARQGCHLFIEKPLSDRLEGLDALAGIAAEKRLIALVGCNMRFHPGPAAVKRLLDEGAIGAPVAARLQTGSYLPDWRPSVDYRQSYSASAEGGGGAVLDCIHEIDLALWYFGPAEVAGAAVLPAESLGLDVDGLAEMLLRHHSGVLSSVHLNFVQRDYRRVCQIIGTEGTLYWDFEEEAVRCYRPKEGWQAFPQPAGWELNRMYLDEMRHFLACLVGEEKPHVDVTGGWRALEIALAAKAWPGARPVVGA